MLRRTRLLDFLGDAGTEFADEISGLLRVSGGGENRAGVVLQNFQPILNVGGMIFAAPAPVQDRRTRRQRLIRQPILPGHRHCCRNGGRRSRGRGGSCCSSSGSAHARALNNSCRHRGRIQTAASARRRSRGCNMRGCRRGRFGAGGMKEFFGMIDAGTGSSVGAAFA